jgi:hypothetical protein
VTRASLASVFDPTSPVAAQVLSGFDGGGMAGAMAAYRAYRLSLPPAHLYAVYRPSDSFVGQADRIMREGLVVADHPAFPLQPPLDWAIDPYHDETFRFRLNSFEWLYPALEAYEETGDQRYLDFGLSLLEDWERDSIEEATANPWAWNDMGSGIRATTVAYLVDAAARSGRASDETLWTLLKAAVVHARHLGDPRTFQPYNHGLYQMLGLLALAQTLPELSQFPQYGGYATGKAEWLLTTSFSADGVHLEHSPDYWDLVLETLEWVSEQGLLDTPEMRDLDERSQQAFAWVIEPDGGLVTFGDTEVGPPILPDEGSRRNPELAWALTEGRQGQPPATTSWVSTQGGYAALRGTWTPAPGEWGAVSYLAVAAATHSSIHKHADDFTFSWTDLGRALIVDSGGPYRYDRSAGRQYVVSTRAHNVVEMDGQDYPVPANIAPVPGSEFTRWTTQGEMRAIEGRVTHLPWAQWRRTLVFSPGHWLLVVDELTSSEDHSYVEWFHFDPGLNVKQEGDLYSASVPGTGANLYVLPILPGDEQPGMLVKGQSDPRMQGWVTLKAEEITPAWALGLPAQGANVAFLTLLALGSGAPAVSGGQPAAAVSPRRILASWEQDSSRTSVEVNREGADLSLQVTVAPAVR